MADPEPDTRWHPGDHSLRDLFRRVHSAERLLRRTRTELKALAEAVRTHALAGTDLHREHSVFGRDLQHLQDRIEGLGRIVSAGNGDRALTTRMALLESELADLKEEVATRAQDHWKLLASLATGLTSLLGTLVLWLVKGGPS